MASTHLESKDCYGNRSLCRTTHSGVSCERTGWSGAVACVSTARPVGQGKKCVCVAGSSGCRGGHNREVIEDTRSWTGKIRPSLRCGSVSDVLVVSLIEDQPWKTDWTAPLRCYTTLNPPYRRHALANVEGNKSPITSNANFDPPLHPSTPSQNKCSSENDKGLQPLSQTPINASRRRPEDKSKWGRK